MHLGAELWRDQSAFGIERTKTGLGSKRCSYHVRHDTGAKAQFSDPGTQYESNKQAVLHRHLAANARRYTRIVLGTHAAEDGERITVRIVRAVGLQPGNPHQFGAQVARQLFDVL